MVGLDINAAGVYLRSEETGLLTPPRTGWQYADPDLEPWQTDDTLQLIF